MVLQEYKRTIERASAQLIDTLINLEKSLYNEERLIEGYPGSINDMPLEDYLTEILTQSHQALEITNAICSFVFDEGKLDREEPMEYPDTLSKLNYATAQINGLLSSTYLNLEDLANNFNCNTSSDLPSTEEKDNYEVDLQVIVNLLAGCNELAHSIYEFVVIINNEEDKGKN